MKQMNPVKFFLAVFLLTAVAGMIVFPAGEWVRNTLFTHTEFVYSVKDHIMIPVILAGFLSVLMTVTTKWDKINKK